MICILWIVGGLAVLVWIGRSIELLPAVLSLLLISADWARSRG